MTTDLFDVVYLFTRRQRSSKTRRGCEDGGLELEGSRNRFIKMMHESRGEEHDKYRERCDAAKEREREREREA